MRFDFEARFSTSHVSLSLLLERLAVSLLACGLHPGPVPRSARRGWDRIDAIDFGDIDLIGKDAAGSGGWSRGLLSTVLYEGLGYTDAIDVVLRVFRVSDDLISVVYNEASRAADYRIKDQDAARNLTAIQIAICDAGSFELSIYDEQNFKRPPIPTLRSVEVAIKRIADEPTRGDCSAVVSTKLLDLERARKLAGPRAGELEVSTNGYIVFPFLRPAKG